MSDETVAKEIQEIADRITEMALRENAFGTHVKKDCLFCRAENVIQRLRSLSAMISSKNGESRS